MDFKEYFGISQGRCHPLSIQDDRSLFSLCFAAYANERRQVVQEHLEGLPRQITMDNGSPWGRPYGRGSDDVVREGQGYDLLVGP
jgi:hypothetical protein